VNDITLSNMQIAQFAERPREPSLPNIPIYLILIAVVGTILGIGLVVVVEYFDSSVSTPQHVWRAVALSTFGVIPDLNSLARGLVGYPQRLLAAAPANKTVPAVSSNASLPAQHLIVDHDPRSVVSEAFRTIRTSLLFAQAEKPPQVILLTSPSPNEGKTLTTLNLGIALAQDGHNVLVIDADLRRGCCHARLGIKNHDGLSNVLAGKLSLQQATKKTSVDRLSLLSRGIVPPNPTDLLGSQVMKRLLDELRGSYDFILIDSPPAIAVSDAPILSVFSDGVLLVFHAKKTTAASARQVVERLDGVRATFLGVVLNGIDLDNPDCSYYKNYYGTYYDETNGPNNGTPRTNATTAQSGLDETADRFGEIGSGTLSPKFFDHLITKFSEATGLQERVDKISAILRSTNEFRPTMSEDGTKEANIGNHPAQQLNINNKRQINAFSQSGSGTVSRELFNRLIAQFSEAVGPMADLIVRDGIARLGESFDSFPTNRLQELVNKISVEIFDARMRENFRQKILTKLTENT
jgi:capsular exopolysaccharide synthesis family protein